MDQPDQRALLDLHWAASDAGDFATEHALYREDAVLEYPQSGERIRGRAHIQASRAAQPNKKRFSIRRHRRQRRSLDYGVHPELRRQAFLCRQHHRVQRRTGHTRDAVLLRPLPSRPFSRRLGRADGPIVLG
jgi:ketosteroid isomerase-like protein